MRRCRDHNSAGRCGLPTICRLILSVVALGAAGSALALSCDGSTAPDDKQLFWGDLHVHSGYSLDAWGFGTAASPADAYAFARGAPLTLADGRTVTIGQPLDFMAVTDHAEWLDLMYVCTDPLARDDPYCRILTERNTPATGSEVFREYVIPTITKAQPQLPTLCEAEPELCRTARLSQWQRIQAQTNEANEPCAFTTFVGFEWSATPGFSHTHRNIIFASERATADALDYLRYPTPRLLWQALERQCRAEDGCEALAIPHNTNMGDGLSFDVESEAPEVLALRAKYERLVEVHQEKGNSECLPAFGATDEDCGFELYVTKRSRPAAAEAFTREEWERMRSSYVRGLLLRGLDGYRQSGVRRLNPLKLGLVGSTDNHMGTGGFTDEARWPGPQFALGDIDRTMQRSDFNPGGIMAVWAKENTRASIFAALKRREVYATSGPRIRARLWAGPGASPCGAPPAPGSVPMGGTLDAAPTGPPALHLTVHAQADRAPLTRIEIVKGELKDGELKERVLTAWQQPDGATDLCVTWQDAAFDPNTPAFWYARILETPTPRWSAYHCRRAGRCDEFPQADRWIRERAWTSPVWHLPAPGS
ncbi:MAG: DUF3604 domain-containing protein [Pseudomonadota bacterium]